MRFIWIARKIAPWAFVALIAFWTLGPIWDRPYTGHAQLERFGAFFVLGFLFALAYPRHWRLVGLAVVMIALGLEFSQLFAQGRHARWSDAAVKVAGGVLGVSLASLGDRLARSPRR
jgi:VanZ family protein